MPTNKKSRKGGKKPRDKGLRFERAVVTDALEKGLKAKRTWGSDGRSMGLSEIVDVVIFHGENNEHVHDESRSDFQCKHFKTLPKYLNLPVDLSGIIMKEDNKPAVVTIRLSWLLDLLSERTHR